ncbi:hypothetical protein ASD02_03770 [Ensifer sp. Root1252]|nr:hypothetical protein ASD00_02135 [Ensifer sp. Root31]KQW63219.1 hypothetical protein ASD02_03770 [Ensifer sp. Root1252]KQW85234.1 hypothetical protein ASD03_05970 [Ensifer sp. Root127]KQY75627.1 hypothetical protein ASD52_24215 [Ensifer sp. Root142]KRC84039.1 hypothetical protein ASE32_03760 [Ensifer sp. Root231]KRD04393.1 hypothetical protein ASE47_02420 [Ensifer sp. Root258]OMQ43329.1 hypothetical protein BKP54_18175 [Ensifer sp. 1H6]
MMLLPTQQSNATATTNLVGSILKDIEKRQAEEDEKAKGTKDDKILKAQVKSDDAQKAANTKINDHFFNQAGNDANNNRMVLIREVGEFFDLKREDFKSDFAFGSALSKIVEDLPPATVRDIEKKLGLTDIDVSLNELIEAIKDPEGSRGKKLDEALDSKGSANTGQSNGATKAIQRLADAAEAKSLDELQLDSLTGDLTRVTDTETLAEQQKELQALQAKDNLEDVQDAREAEAERPLPVRIDEIGRYSLASQTFIAA